MSTDNVKHFRKRNLFSVFVGHLHEDVSKSDVYKLFSGCGEIVDYCILEDGSGKSRSYKYGFVRYAFREEAMRALKELNGWTLMNVRIVVDVAKDTVDLMKKAEEPASGPDLLHLDPHDGPEKDTTPSCLDKIINLSRVKEACHMMDVDRPVHKGAIRALQLIDTVEMTGGAENLRVHCRPVSSRTQLSMKRVSCELSKWEQDKGIDNCQLSKMFLAKSMEISETVSRLLDSESSELVNSSSKKLRDGDLDLPTATVDGSKKMQQSKLKSSADSAQEEACRFLELPKCIGYSLENSPQAKSSSNSILQSSAVCGKTVSDVAELTGGRNELNTRKEKSYTERYSCPTGSQNFCEQKSQRGSTSKRSLKVGGKKSPQGLSPKKNPKGIDEQSIVPSKSVPSPLSEFDSGRASSSDVNDEIGSKPRRSLSDVSSDGNDEASKPVVAGETLLSLGRALREKMKCREELCPVVDVRVCGPLPSPGKKHSNNGMLKNWMGGLGKQNGVNRRILNESEEDVEWDSPRLGNRKEAIRMASELFCQSLANDYPADTVSSSSFVNGGTETSSEKEHSAECQLSVKNNDDDSKVRVGMKSLLDDSSPLKLQTSALKSSKLAALLKRSQSEQLPSIIRS